MFKNIKTIDLATSGASYTITQNEMVFNAYDAYYITGTRAGFTLTTSGTVDTNSTVTVLWVGTPTGVVDILGTTMPSNIQAKDCVIEARYNGATWDVFFDIDTAASGFIVDSDVSATAAIQRSKLASGTADHVLINDGSGVMSSEAQLANTRGGTGQDSSAFTGVAKVSAGTWSASTIVNADVNAAAAIAYSKLATLNTGQILAGNAGVPTAVTMSGDATISATGVVTIPNLLWEEGSGGATSLKNTTATDASDTNSLAAGVTAEASALSSLAVGHNATASGIRATALGPDTDALGEQSSAIGRNAIASGQNSNAFGTDATSRIDDSTNISGAIIIQNAFGAGSEYQLYSGAEVIIMSNTFDAEATGTQTITFPTGVRMFVNEVGFIATSANTVTVQPTISYGINGNNTALLAATLTTGISAAGDRDRQTTLVTYDGVTSLTAEVTIVGAATTLVGRVYFKGFIVENQ